MKRLPLFDDYFSKKLLQPHIEAITEAVSAQKHDVKQPGWMTGLSGVAVFLGENAFLYGEKSKVSEEAAGVLARIMEVINGGFTFPTFAAGLTGILFVFRYLGERRIIDSDEAHALDEIIPFIEKWGQSRIDEGDFDLLHGGLGPFYVQSLECSMSDTWVGRYERDSLNIDLGLAHGIPSYLQFLSRTEHSRIHQDVVMSDIKSVLGVLLSYADFTMKNGSVFPTRIKDGIAQYPSRLAWCYGDVGIGISLMIMGDRFNGLTGVGERVLELAAARRDPINTRVSDPYLCHGSSGLALIFFKAYLLSKNDKFKEAAQYWTKETLNYLDSTHSPAKSKDMSLLNGLSGIGLTLMAIDKGYLPGWQKGLML